MTEEVSDGQIKREVKKSVEKEFEDFKAEMTVNHTQEDVFHSAFEIFLKTEFLEALQEHNEVENEDNIYHALHRERGTILENLYMDFIGEENASCNSSHDIALFIKDYCERNYPDIMAEEEIHALKL